MRILLLTPDPPAPTHINGGTTRQYHLYKRLIELGHEVVVVAPFPYVEEPYIEALRADGFEVHELQRPQSRLKELLSALLRRPSLLLKAFKVSTQSLIGAVYWVDLESIATQVLKDRSIDLICVEQEFASSWVADLDTQAPMVLISQQVESAYNAERAERRSGLSRQLARRDARLCQQSERKWTPLYDAVVCMSEHEIELLRESVGTLPPAYAIGNGADFEWLADLAPDPGSNGVLFTGTMSFEPNSVGAEWLARDAWPHVRERVPSAQLRIVGRNPSAATLALGELAGVTVHGSVPDMKPFFEGASVCTLPMLEGGGTRLKLAEAFAARRAVVATTNGATGVDVADGQNILIRDGAQAFGNGIADLLEDAELRERISNAGWATAERDLNWSRLGERFGELLDDVLRARRG